MKRSDSRSASRFSALLLVIVLISSLCLALASCANPPAGTSSVPAGESQESAGTGAEESAPSNVADNTQFYDEITRKMKLEKSFEGKNFLTDGIGEATVSAFTDGDTTRFRLSSGEVVIVRYYEVDTPESTSNIEKWGKAASNFTKKCLSGAEQIVLEATAARAQHDSYGTRYLGYVWYRPQGETSFKCMNLELVENGFTDNKGINTEDYPYYSYFNEANRFAKSIQLRLYSSLDDPLFTTDPSPLSLAEFEDNPDLYYDPDTDTGAKVSLTACLTSLYVSDSGTYTFTATEIDPETGEKHTINVYAGYTSSPASGMKLGHLYKIVGNLQKYGGKFQISGLHYNAVYQIDNGDYTIAKQKDYHLTFDSGLSFISQYSQTLYTDAVVRSVKSEGETLTVEAEAFLRTKNGQKDEVSAFTFKIPASFLSEGESISEGDALRVEGYQFEEGSGVIDVVSENEFSLIPKN